MRRSIRVVVTTLVLMFTIVLTFSACQPVSRRDANGMGAIQPVIAVDRQPVVYLLQQNSLRLVRSTGQITTAGAEGLLQLLKQPGVHEELVSPIPDGVTFKVVDTNNRLMTIEMVITGTPHWGTRREAILFDSIVLTLCELPEVDAVRFVLNGSYSGRVDLSVPFDANRLLAPQESYNPQ